MGAELREGREQPDKGRYSYFLEEMKRKKEEYKALKKEVERIDESDQKKRQEIIKKMKDLEQSILDLGVKDAESVVELYKLDDEEKTTIH